MRTLAAELYKSVTYRWPVLLLAGGLALCALMCLVAGTSYCTSATSYITLTANFSELIMRVVWLLLPVVVMGGDVVDGTLSPALLVRPAPARLMAAKAATTLILTAVSVVVLVVLVLVPALAWPDAGQALGTVGPTLLRLLPAPFLAALFGLSVVVLTGLRRLAWVGVLLVAWTQVVDKLMFSVVSNVANPYLGAVLSPYDTYLVWANQDWGHFDLPSLNTWGFVPLLTTVLLVAAAATTLVLVTADPAGRPWGTRAVRPPAVQAAPAALAAPAGQRIATRSGATVVPDGAVPGAHAAPESTVAHRSSFLRDVLRWVRALTVRAGTLRLALTGLLVPLLVTTGACAMLAVTFDLGDLDGKTAVLCVAFVLSYLGLVILLTGAWLYLRETGSRQLANVYCALPRRSAVVVGTAALASVYAALAGLLSALGGVAGFALSAGMDVAATLADPHVVRCAVSTAVAFALLELTIVAVAVLVRRPTAALAGVIAWMLLVEQVVSLVPHVGGVLGQWSLSTSQGSLMVWDQSPVAHAGWLVVVGAVAMSLAVVVERRRVGVVAA